MPKIRAWVAARLRHGAHRVEERLVAELAEDAHLRGEVVGTDHHHVDAGHRRDLVGAAPPRRGLEHHRHDRLLVEGVEQLALAASGGTGWRGWARRPSGARAAGSGTRRRPAPLRRASLDVRDDHAHRADVERPREVLVVVGGHPHQRRDPGRDRTRAQHRRRLERRGGVLEVDVHRVEPRGRRHHRDVGRARLRQGHAEHEVPGVEPLAHRRHALHHARSERAVVPSRTRPRAGSATSTSPSVEKGILTNREAAYRPAESASEHHRHRLDAGRHVLAGPGGGADDLVVREPRQAARSSTISASRRARLAPRQKCSAKPKATWAGSGARRHVELVRPLPHVFVAVGGRVEQAQEVARRSAARGARCRRARCGTCA